MDKPEKPYELGVAVVTPKGFFPNDDDYRRAYANERIQTLLDAVKNKQGITNTDGWVVTVNERVVDPSKTFEEEGLKCVLDMEWHKAEGGGGA
jgi:hypothetical protein